MPTEVNGVLRYDIHDDHDMSALIASGLIWRGGPQAVQAAIEFLRNHPEAVNDMVPKSVLAVLRPEPESPAEDATEPKEEPEQETPAEDANEPTEEPGAPTA